MADKHLNCFDSYQPVSGVLLASAAAGIRYRERDDLVLMGLPTGTRCAAVFTRNAFCAAPVLVAKRHLALATPRYLLINSGNANAGTGEQGLSDAQVSCSELATATGCRPEEVLPFSTGVIGERLPVERLVATLPAALSRMSESAWPQAARAIMTTDTVPKLATGCFTIGGHMAVITGMAKGAGMICPDMATMLAFVATDLAVDQGLLHDCLQEAMETSFNAITVDGDTSTNDACVLAATGTLGNDPVVDPASPECATFRTALTEVCRELARAIVRDGEGATKLVTVRVEEAADSAEARRVAATIANSPLVKTALFACDPNWGRILAAVGRAGLDRLDIEAVRIWLGDLCIVSHGGRDPDYSEAAGQTIMNEEEFEIRVALGRGQAVTELMTCDLSYDYVRINAEYRT